MILPVRKERSGAAMYRKVEPIAFKLAYAVSCITPAFKERLPRLLGRWLCGGRQFCVRTHRGAYLAVDVENMDHYTRLKRLRGWDEHVLTACLDLLDERSVFY